MGFILAFGNNANVIVTGINAIISGMIATCGTTIDQLGTIHQQFLHISSLVLLRARPEKDGSYNESILSSYFFLYRYVQVCPFLFDGIFVTDR